MSPEIASSSKRGTQDAPVLRMLSRRAGHVVAFVLSVSSCFVAIACENDDEHPPVTESASTEPASGVSGGSAASGGSSSGGTGNTGGTGKSDDGGGTGIGTGTDGGTTGTGGDGGIPGTGTPATTGDGG